MRKGRLIFAGVAAVLLLAPAAFAQNSEGVSQSGEAQAPQPAKQRVEERTRLLQNIRDQKKRALIQRADDRLIEMNKDLTGRYSRIIAKVEEQFNKISLRADELAGEGKDVQTVRTAVQKAREAISGVKNEISVQADKIYSVDFKDETTAKAGLGEVRRKLRDDMAVLREKLRLAHRATVEALVALKQLNK